MGLDGEGISSEGGAIADVGDGFEGFWPDRERSDVDAVGGQEFGVRREVDGGDGVASTVAAAGRGGAIDGEGAAEQRAGGTDVAGGDELADAAGRDRRPAYDAGSVDGDAEAECAAEGFETADACFGVVAEAEVFTFVDLGDVEFVDQDASVKGRTRVASIPVAARSSSLRGSGVMSGCGCSGRNTRAGWGSKVMARDWPPRKRARAMTSAMTDWWPRCTPSKLPMVATTGVAGVGKSSSWV